MSPSIAAEVRSENSYYYNSDDTDSCLRDDVPPPSTQTSTPESENVSSSSSSFLTEKKEVPIIMKKKSNHNKKNNDDTSDVIDDYFEDVIDDYLKEESEILDDDEKEISYKSSKVTPLFKAVEKCNWEKAFHLVSSKDSKSIKQLKIWIHNDNRNNAQDDKILGCSSWRRLPIHEALRRQPPAWLISAMLGAYPDAATEKTEFLQLPLHIAVEKSASPEVVNLVTLSNMQAILERDNSGRTPLEIVQSQQQEVHDEQDEEDRAVVYNSLVSCYRTLVTIENTSTDRLQQVQDDHDAQIKAMTHKHQIELNKEIEKQKKLRLDLNGKDCIIDKMTRDRIALEEHISECDEKQDHWNITKRHLEQQLEKVRLECDTHIKHVQALKDLILTKDQIIQQNDSEIRILKSDLHNVSSYIDNSLIQQYNKVENDLRTMLDSQRNLKRGLKGHSNSLHALLKERGGGGGGTTTTTKNNNKSTTKETKQQQQQEVRHQHQQEGGLGKEKRSEQIVAGDVD